MSFIKYDLIFLLVFCIGLVWFLYKNRKNVDKEGILFLYKTQLGVKFIERFSKRFERMLKGLQYLVIAVSYFLMAGIIYLIFNSFWIYIRHSKELVEVVKAPPIAPVIPYFPKLFGLESFFPPFYFAYFIIAIGIVAIVHEFAHGIYMKVHGVRIKSTGFAFLGPILGAFVEQDDEQMKNKSIKQQLSILGAGVFANLLTGLIFLVLFIGMFYMVFSPVGYIFTGYSSSAIDLDSIERFEILSEDLTEIYVGEKKYFLYQEQNKQLVEGELRPIFDRAKGERIFVTDNSPAFNIRLEGIIYDIDGIRITSHKKLLEVLENKSPGEIVEIRTVVNISDDKTKEMKIYNFPLGKNPKNESVAYLGIVSNLVNSNFVSLMSPEEPSVYYEQKINSDLLVFIYYLIFWIVLINILVALFNMLPLGILDGGRFFYLTILKMTGSEKTAKLFFSAITYLILFGFALITFIWLFEITNFSSIMNTFLK